MEVRSKRENSLTTSDSEAEDDWPGCARGGVAEQSLPTSAALHA
jgi:hypothetical protein